MLLSRENVSYDIRSKGGCTTVEESEFELAFEQAPTEGGKNPAGVVKNIR